MSVMVKVLKDIRGGTRYHPGTDDLVSEVVIEFQDDPLLYFAKIGHPSDNQVVAKMLRELAAKIEKIEDEALSGHHALP